MANEFCGFCGSGSSPADSRRPLVRTKTLLHSLWFRTFEFYCCTFWIHFDLFSAFTPSQETFFSVFLCLFCVLFFSPHKTAIAAKLSDIRNQTATFQLSQYTTHWALWLFFFFFSKPRQHTAKALRMGIGKKGECMPTMGQANDCNQQTQKPLGSLLLPSSRGALCLLTLTRARPSACLVSFSGVCKHKPRRKKKSFSRCCAVARVFSNITNKKIIYRLSRPMYTTRA